MVMNTAVGLHLSESPFETRSNGDRGEPKLPSPQGVHRHAAIEVARTPRPRVRLMSKIEIL